jgi:cytidylate kinase
MNFKTPAKATINQMIESQMKQWEVGQKKKYKEPIRPVITMSRLPGSGAWFLARRLAEELKIDYFDREIIEEVAKSAKVSKRMISTLDEQDRGILDDWIDALGDRHVWPDEYINHLTKVVGTIGAHGHAIIMGRGASFIIPPEVSLRVLVVAPLEVRINNVAAWFKISKAEAKTRLTKVESSRNTFIRKYFRADPTDPMHYDLVINTQNFDLEAATRIVKEAFNARQWYDYSIRWHDYTVKDIEKK